MIDFFKKLFKKEPKLTIAERLDEKRMELQESKDRLTALIIKFKQ